MPRRAINPTIEIAKALAKLGKASFGDILKEADISRQALDIHLKRMLDKKLILSEQDPKDKRKYLYWLNPNELAIITVDEVIEAIREELKAVNEELKAEEEQALREILVKDIRKSIIEELKAGFLPIRDKEIDHILGHLTASINAKLIVDYLKKILKELSEEEISDKKFAQDLEDKVKRRLPNLSFITPTAKAITKIPNSFISKWQKTKAYRSNQTTLLLNFAYKWLELASKELMESNNT